MKTRMTEFSAEVMVVEDEACVRLFIERALKDFGYAVSCYETAEAALEALSHGHPRLIITDYRLGDMSGVEFLKEVRLNHPSVPIIGMSGEHHYGKRMLESGASMFLEKPFSVECLAEALPTASI